MNREAVLEILKSKCEFKGIAVPTLEWLRASPQHAALRADWDQMLAHQLPELPPFDSFWNELPAVFDWLREAPVKVRPPVMGPGRHEIDVGWRAPAMASSWRAQGITAPLEIIRFAAANHLCVELDYQDEGGRRGTRTIEPYSLRRTKGGDLLLYAVRSQDGQDRSYRVDRIVGARATKQAFTPRYTVELSVVEPLNAPRISRTVAALPRRATMRPATRRGSGFGQMKYVFQCPYCDKKFERTKHDFALNPHKTKDGYPCPGRVGHYVETKY